MEGGRGRVLWIEKSGVHPGSGLEHGRSAQQELEWGRRASDARYVPLGCWSRHHLGGTYRSCCAPRQGEEGQCQGSPGRIPYTRTGWVGGLRCNYRDCSFDQGYIYLLQRGSSAQSRLPGCDCAKRIKSSGRLLHSSTNLGLTLSVGQCCAPPYRTVFWYSLESLHASLLCASMLAAARRGSSQFWPQTDRLKTDIAGGSRSWSSLLNFPTVSSTFSTVKLYTPVPHTNCP